MEMDGYHPQKSLPDHADELYEAERDTNASLEYVTELQNKVSSAMINDELPFVISSAVYENSYRLHVVVTSDSEDDLQKLKGLDTVGVFWKLSMPLKILYI